MGEYAKHKGEEIKIGTCENMYYLRFDQRHKVKALPGNVDPNGEDAYALRFRFPWPNEDKNEPGQFEDYGKAVAVHYFDAYGAHKQDDIKAPAGVEHYSVQFVASAGYLVSLPCPEGPQVLELPLNGGTMTVDLEGLNIHRNGFSGAVQLVQQKFLKDGRLVPVCRCGGCGTAWRVEEPSDIEALAVAFRGEGDSRIRQSRDQSPQEGAFWHTIADRILEGAKLKPVDDGGWEQAAQEQEREEVQS